MSFLKKLVRSLRSLPFLPRPSRGLALLLLVSSPCLYAGTFIAYGPQNYQRGTGSPVTVTDTFSVLNPSTQYTLKAINGGLENSSTELVSSSIVTLNGVQVIGPSNFNQNVTEVDVPVTVQTLNTLAVEVRGQPGGVLAIEIIGVDNDPPTIKSSISPVPNAAGWNNSNVTVTFTCSDATSGVANCPSPQTVTTEGANQTITGTATDNAGNTAIATVVLNIAKTPPKITSAALPAANANGWNNSSVTVSFVCVTTIAPLVSCPAPRTVTTDGAAQAISATVTDVAGNTTTASITVNIDQMSPTISATTSPPPNASGSFTSNVTVSFACSDALSGIATCPSPQLVPASAGSQVISGTATDNAGNRATTSVSLTFITNPPPTIMATIAPSPNAAGWNNSPVTVTFNCSGGSGGVASCSAPVMLNSEGANQVVTGTAQDQAGQTASATATVNIDLSPPTVTATANPAPNAGGWNNSNVTVNFQCADNVSGVATCPPPVTVSSEGVTTVQSQSATDLAGNSATTSIAVKVDKTPPTVAITSPASGNVYSAQTLVSGTVSDASSGVASVSCNGAQAQLIGSSFTCNVSLSTGGGTISVTASDGAGNLGFASTNVTLVPAPVVTITSPSNLSYTNVSPITVQGSIDSPADTVTINGIAAFPTGGSFTATVPLVEGVNTLTVVATNAGANQGTASVNVTLDTTPPHLTVDSPANNSITTSGFVSVTGIVNDIVPGTVNETNAEVTVNGTAAQVANRTYSIANVPLSLGPNTIQAVARDQAGNAATTTITITRVSAAQPPAPAIGQPAVNDTLSIVAGNNQSAAIATQLPSPLVVALTDPSGNPVPNQPVVFKVTANDGIVTSASASAAGVTVNTDANGRAQVLWTLGHRSGVGINRVEASSAVSFVVTDFTAVGIPGPAAQIVVDSGDNQTGAGGQPLTFPLGVVVTDSGHNRIAGVPVTFSVVIGGGSFNGVSTQTITTDTDGRALATLTLGAASDTQPSSNIVAATFPGSPSSAAAFTATALLAGDPTKTTISGDVLDNSNNPIAGVTMRLYQTNQGSNNNQPLQIGTPVQTDVQGHFVITNTPYGYFKLLADGTTAGGGSVSYPTLEYDIVTVAGQDNSVGTPIYLPVLSATNQLCVDATHGGTLTLPEAPGFSLTVASGSATFPGGARQGCVSVSTVHGDKVPMAPGFGQQPRFIVTIQPVGTVFNPPAAMTLPNVDGLGPRAKTEMYSYDHDLGMFVAIGTATVSDDGSLIVSDPGTGVLKAGWHCGGDPNATGSVADCGECKVCGGPDVGCLPIDGIPCGTAPQVQGFDLSYNGGTDTVQIHLGQACASGNICNRDGACVPPSNGFDQEAIRDGLNQALGIVFDNSNICIEAGLRKQMQSALKNIGLYIDCAPQPPDDPNVCAVEMGDGLNHLTLLPMTFKKCDYPVPAILLHELVHGPGGDAGTPLNNVSADGANSGYHNVNSDYLGPDCRDRAYGCMSSCFIDVEAGDAEACALTPAEHGQLMNGCGKCQPVTYTWEDGAGQHTETQTICPTLPY